MAVAAGPPAAGRPLPAAGAGSPVSRCRPSGDLEFLPLIDTHNHLMPRPPEALGEYLDALASEANRYGVRRILVGLNARPLPLRPPTYSREHDDVSLAAFRRHPDLFVPLLAGFDPSDPSAPDYVRSRLATEPWKGIGELDLRNEVRKTAVPADAPPLMRIYRLAAQYNLPVLLHYSSGYGAPPDRCRAELEHAFESHPDTLFVLAHQQATLGMWKHPNVIFQVDGDLGPIIPEHSARTLAGTDFQGAVLEGTRETGYLASLRRIRAALIGLSPAQARDVASRNAARIFRLEPDTMGWPDDCR